MLLQFDVRSEVIAVFLLCKAHCLSLLRLLSQLPAEGQKLLCALFQMSMSKGLALIERCKHHFSLPVSMAGLVNSLTSVLSSLLVYIQQHGGFAAAPSPSSSKEKEKSNEADCPVGPGGPKVVDELLAQRPDEVISNYLSGGVTGFGVNSGTPQPSPVTVFSRHPWILRAVLGKVFVMAYVWTFGSYFQLVSVLISWRS